MARNSYPLKILFLCEKGGVGKSTLVDEFAFMSELHGVPYNLIDLDGQGGLLHKPKETPNAVLEFIDTPGKLLRNTQTIIDAADVVIVPTLMDQKNLDTIERMIRMLEPWRRTGKPVIYVHNQFDGSIAAEHFAEWWDVYHSDIPFVILSRSVIYKNCHELGKSVTQVMSAKSRRELWALYWTTMHELGEEENIKRIMMVHDGALSPEEIEQRKQRRARNKILQTKVKEDEQNG